MRGVLYTHVYIQHRLDARGFAVHVLSYMMLLMLLILLTRYRHVLMLE